MIKTPGRIRMRSAATACILLTCLFTSNAQAQNYRFAVPELGLQVYIQNDGQVRVVYDIQFQNQPGAHAIDIVDIGMPHERYAIPAMSAKIGNQPLRLIRPSKYVKPGVEVPLGAHQIPGGQSGLFHFEYVIDGLLYQDTTRRDYASFRITPTWFDGRFVVGQTRIRIAIHLPPQVGETDVRQQKINPYRTLAKYDDRLVAYWEIDAPLTGPHMVGVSFAKQGIAGVRRMSRTELVNRWLKANPTYWLAFGALGLVLFSFLFLRLTGKTGFVLLVLCCVGLGFLFYSRPATAVYAVFLLPVPILLFEWKGRRRRARYLPPIVEREGGGVRRGLSPPEAAVLLERPLGEVLMLVLIGLIRKGLIECKQTSPMVVVASKDLRDVATSLQALRKVLRQPARKKGIAVHEYEELFLWRIGRSRDKPITEIDFSKAMKLLVMSTARKMKGYDLSETRDYYRSQIDRQLLTALAANTPPELNRKLDRGFEWVMLHDDRERLFKRRDYSYDPFVPRHYGYYHPHYHRGARPLGATESNAVSAAASGPAPGTTSFADIKDSFTGWFDNMTNSLRDIVTPGALDLGSKSGGVVDLSGLDRATSDFFQALGESSGGGGGGGCACACAGCACACACAGGGR